MSIATNIDIKVQSLHKFSNGQALKAFANIVVADALLVKGVRILEGRYGLFVAMPRDHSARHQKWFDAVKCLNKEIKEKISQEVLKAYERQ